ncbi:MAG: hypothetical protein Q7J54_07855 [Candidatus Woesearchaeota archaeon]|nr:hypothetical protein [Candidatus Woesearchaeota archaeon]
MKKTKEPKNESKIYYHCNTWEDHSRLEDLRKEGLLTKRKNEITEAYMGREPDYGLYGLHLMLDSNLGTAGVSYLCKKDIKGIMHDVGVDKAKELVGKYVLSYCNGVRAVGISAYKK